MRLIMLTPGAGENFYCENCLRDHALIRRLRRDGHDILMVPMYLPPIPEFDVETDQPVFFGGINVYLQQKCRLFRHTPRWLDRMLDSPRVLKLAQSMAGMTRAKDLGETTVSMLRGEEGKQTKELDRLVAFLAEQEKPDVVCLSNIMLGGLTPRIREALGVPVVTTAQDEDAFLDSLPEPYRSEAWELLRRRAREVDGLMVTCEYYRDVMAERLGFDARDFHVTPNGIDMEGYTPAPQGPADPPRLGFLSPLSYNKGLDTLLDAYLMLRKRPGLGELKLHLTGGRLASQKEFLRRFSDRLDAEGVADDVTIFEEFDRKAKIDLLPPLRALSVPTRMPEASGLYLLEAMACGVPVVQPDHGVFREILRDTGGGLLYRPGETGELADALQQVLTDDGLHARLARAGRQAVVEKFTIAHAAGALTDAINDILHRKGPRR